MPPGGLERRSLSGSFSQEASLAGQRHHGRRHRDLGGGLEGLVGGVPTSCRGCQRLNLAILLPCGKRACVVEEDFFVFYLALALFAIMIRAHCTMVPLSTRMLLSS